MNPRLLVFISLVVLLLAACGQAPQQQPRDQEAGLEGSEFVIVPDGLSAQAVNTPRLVVQLGFLSTTNPGGVRERQGQARFMWSDTATTLTGTADVRLRKVASNATLVENNDVTIDSNATLYSDPLYTSHLAKTPITTEKSRLCVEITDWDLSTQDYTFNNQSFPLVFCQVNTTETGADMSVALDSNSANGLHEKEFPFVIAVQNFGPRSADDVKVDITLPSNVSFVRDNSGLYTCTEATAGSGEVSCAATKAVAVGRRSLPLILTGKTIATEEVSVSVSTTSTDPVSSNNSFTADIDVAENCDLFTDANLESRVRAELGIYEPTPLCADDMLNLMYLFADHANISDLTGLEHATNIHYLFLDNNSLTDISSLATASLPNLIYLFLSHNSLTDISGLATASLPNLTHLSLTTNNLTDISGLATASLPSLTYLSLENNNLTDISGLATASLPSLTQLDLNYNNLTDISSLATASLPNLIYLFLTTNSLTDISGLATASLPSLTYLSLDSNNLTDISGLATASLPSLTHLSLTTNSLTDIQALVDNTALGTGDTIHLYGNSFDTTAGSDAMTDIATLQDRGVYVSY